MSLKELALDKDCCTPCSSILYTASEIRVDDREGLEDVGRVLYYYYTTNTRVRTHTHIYSYILRQHVEKTVIASTSYVPKQNVTQ
jgi:hypothetical protein